MGRYDNPVSSLVKICTVSALSAGENTTTFLVMVTKGTPLLLRPSKFLDKETKIIFLVMEYSVLFDNVFEALNLFINKYVAEI